ncbi:MAG: hypothetical protein GVY24_03420, partial [Planctomycetes bacterium]|nr:hypothetical protein [Planctomycetota bacterium]
MDPGPEPQATRGQALSPRVTVAAITALVLLGVATRLAQFVFGRSLWLDELLLALNIESRGFGGLLEPLDYGQFAPVGFLWTTKAAVLALGPGEQAYRLVAFAAGVGALLLFVPLVRRLASPAGCVLGVGLFACLPRLVFYSSELKQYSVGLFAVTLVLLLTVWLWESDRAWWRWLLLAVAGVVLQFFSLTVIFALGASAMVVTLDQLWRRQWRGAAAGTVIGLAWAGQFVGLYLLFYRYGSESGLLNTYWAGAFMPRPIASMDTAKWLIESWYQIIPTEDGRGGGEGLQVHRYSGVLGLLMLAGLFEVYRRSPRLLALLLVPLALLLLAAGVQAYPIFSRLVLFAAVIVLALAAAGGGLIFDLVAKQRPRIAVLLLAAVLVFPVGYALMRIP